MIYRRTVKIPGVASVLLLVFMIAGCGKFKKNHAHSDIPDSSIEKGQALAKQYCQTCHALPEPGLLDVKSWERGVLPHMGPLFGIFSYNGRFYPNSRDDRYLDKSYYPNAPTIPKEDWQHILDYYEALSPDSLPGQNRPMKIEDGLSLFKVLTPASAGHGPPPTTCLVRLDTTGGQRSLLTGDVITKRITRWDANLRVLDTVHEGGVIVDLPGADWGLSARTSVGGASKGGGRPEGSAAGNGFAACDIGVMNPTNGKFGSIREIHIDANGKMKVDTAPLFNDLARPVQVTPVDLNGDGRMDYLICEFGYMTGGLCWMENKGDSGYLRHVIRGVPGAIKAYVRDVNHDGRPDLWVLFAQAEEGIFLFINQGNGQFSSQEVLRFPPANGSSYFELDDFNRDGAPDIVYTCGDNADFSPVLKPYHGVYIFMNDGQNHFTQQYFFPVNGCYKAIARDFDGDGDLDLAVISFFADYKNQPEEGFVYLENQGGFQFKPYSIPEAKSGRWLTMDAGDLDGDGRPDIILGNFSVAPANERSGVDWRKSPPFLVLKNQGK